MLRCGFFKLTALVLGLGAASASAQTADNSAVSGTTNPTAVQQPAAPPQVLYGGTVSNPKTRVVPVGGDAKIHGSTVPAAKMPREESLGDAARRLKRKKYRKYHKQH